MSKVKNENYISIQGWMVNELNLKGNELLVYAIIYGFSQEENQKFAGSIQYLANWIGSSKQTVFNCLKSLIEKGLIEKKETFINGVKFCEYQSKFLMGVVKIFDGGSQKIRPNNINNNIDYINNNSSSSIEKCDTIYDFLEQNFGRTLNSIEIEMIREWNDNELTRYAIKQAVLNGKYNVKYINTILVNYKNNSITTVQQAQEEEKMFKSKKEIKKSRTSAMDETIKEIYNGTIKLQ
ncbi:MAG: DnaD domain protein [Clostridium sp.]|nr:DnaD domain protein [Clostridium sp.]